VCPWPKPEPLEIRFKDFIPKTDGEGNMPAAPVTGALGATSALLVRPVEVLGGLKRPNGITRAVAAGADGRRLCRAIGPCWPDSV